MAMRRSVNGSNGGNGEFIAWLQANLAAHEKRMARLENADRMETNKLEEMRRQTREIVLEIGRLDADRKAESARNRAESVRNLAEHRSMMAAMQAIHGRVVSLETGRKG